MRTTLFTGAGASKAIGYPLTRELLPQVWREIKNGELFARLNGKKRDAEDRDELEKYLRALYPGIDDVAPKDLPLITDSFSLVEYALSAGEALAIGNDKTLRRCRDLLKQAITDVLLGAFEEAWDVTDPKQKGEQQTLHRLVRWIENQGSDFGMVTTNYDIGIEHELYKHLGGPTREKIYAGIDLGFDWRHSGKGDERRRPHDSTLHIYKLHGSLDTLRCSSCGYVYFNPWGTIAFNAFLDDLTDQNTCHCRKDIQLELHIVSPSLVREIRDANLLSVWRSALEWMRHSKHWIIAGYSLPSEDIAIRSLLLRAYMTAQEKPRVTVVQNDDNAKTAYKLLFPGCDYHNEGFGEYLKTLT